jgi:hypothetical protein
MLDDQQLEEHVRELIIDICEVLYLKGYEVVPIGAVMRLVGVGEDRAKLHDDQYLALDSEFEIILQTRKEPPPESAPAGVTLH